jgi:hypothetical protein
MLVGSLNLKAAPWILWVQGIRDLNPYVAHSDLFSALIVVIIVT